MQRPYLMDPKLKALIDDLPADALKRAHDYIVLRMAFGLSGGAMRTDDYPGIVLDIIIDECRRAGLDPAASPSRLKHARHYKPFVTKIEDEGLADFFRDASERNRIRARKLIRLGISLLIENLVQMNVAISATTVMAHVHRIPGVLNQAFPGYAAEGLLSLVTEGKASHVRKK